MCRKITRSVIVERKNSLALSQFDYKCLYATIITEIYFTNYFTLKKCIQIFNSNKYLKLENRIQVFSYNF